MKKTDILIGLIIGLISTTIGSFLFLQLFTNYNLFIDFELIKSEGILGKVITLGAILNILVFYILIKRNKEFMSRGVILATILLALSTLFL